MNISEVLEKILLKPDYYLEAVSITRLWAYLQGFTMALRDANVSFEDGEFDDFCKWVDQKYGLRTTNSCAEIILFKSHGDEFKAIERMKLLWIAFRNERNSGTRTIDCSKDGPHEPVVEGEYAKVVLSSVFDKVLLKPELFAGRAVMRIWGFIEGYKKALNDADIPYDSSDFDVFCSGMESRYKSIGVDHNYAEVVLLSAFHDELHAIEELREQWVKFKDGQIRG